MAPPGRWTTILGCVLLLSAAGCETRAPCRRLADRDCARHGEQSAICRDSRARAASADPYLAEVCRHVLDHPEDQR